MISIGIDPGKHGAMAMINGDSVSVQPIPTILGGKGARVEYDLVMIRNWLVMAKSFTLEVMAKSLNVQDIWVYVEKAQPLPKSFGGGIANFERGRCTGWAWMLTALSIPYQLVPPRTWQKVMFAGTPGADTKQRSIIAAQRLYPDVSLLRTERSRKPDHGMSDALLIAEFGRRKHQ